MCSSARLTTYLFIFWQHSLCLDFYLNYKAISVAVYLLYFYVNSTTKGRIKKYKIRIYTPANRVLCCSLTQTTNHKPQSQWDILQYPDKNTQTESDLKCQLLTSYTMWWCVTRSPVFGWIHPHEYITADIMESGGKTLLMQLATIITIFQHIPVVYTPNTERDTDT